MKTTFSIIGSAVLLLLSGCSSDEPSNPGENNRSEDNSYTGLTGKSINRTNDHLFSSYTELYKIFSTPLGVSRGIDFLIDNTPFKNDLPIGDRYSYMYERQYVVVPATGAELFVSRPEPSFSENGEASHDPYKNERIYLKKGDFDGCTDWFYDLDSESIDNHIRRVSKMWTPLAWHESQRDFVGPADVLGLGDVLYTSNGKALIRVPINETGKTRMIIWTIKDYFTTSTFVDPVYGDMRHTFVIVQMPD